MASRSAAIKRIVVSVEGRGQARMRAAPADDRSRSDELRCPARQRRQSEPEDVAQRRRQGRAALLGARDELLDVERQAVGALEEGIDEGRRRCLTKDGGELLEELVSPEGSEVESFDAIAALQLPEERHQRMCAGGGRRFDRCTGSGAAHRGCS